MFLIKVKNSEEAGVDEVCSTRKTPLAKVDHQVIHLLDRAVGEYAGVHITKTMTGIARMLQTVKACYQEATTSIRTLSPWKKCIEYKTSSLTKSKVLIERKGSYDKTTKDETKAARKVIRQFNLVLDKPHDVTEVIAKLNVSIRVYEKKLEMYEQRMEVRRQNQCFELCG